MLNVDYSRRLKTTGVHAYHDKPQAIKIPAKGKTGFPLFIGAILLFTGGMVVGLNLNQSEQKFQNNQSELSLNNVSKENFSVPDSTEGAIASKAEEEKSTQESNKEEVRISDSSQKPIPNSASPAFYPKNLKFPPKMDQINYIIEIGGYEPAESSRIGKMVSEHMPELQGKLFRTSTGKLFAGYFYSQEEAKQTLEHLRAFEKDDFTDASIKTVRF